MQAAVPLLEHRQLIDGTFAEPLKRLVVQQTHVQVSRPHRDYFWFGFVVLMEMSRA